MKSAWTPDAPTLYELMLYTRPRRAYQRVYPVAVPGSRTWSCATGSVWINGSRASLAAADYDAAPDAAATERELKALKKGGFNTVCVSYPQPAWFYGLCDRVGCYVIDQANVNAGYRTDDPNVGGSVANAPDFLPQFIDRVCAMQGRSKNHTSVVALSLGTAIAATGTTSTRLTSGSRQPIRCIWSPTATRRGSGTPISISLPPVTGGPT